MRHIAEVLGLSDDDALRALGGGWRPVDDPFLSLQSGGWFVTGQPMQVLLGVGGFTLPLARIVLSSTPSVTFSRRPDRRRNGA